MNYYEQLFIFLNKVEEKKIIKYIIEFLYYIRDD